MWWKVSVDKPRRGGSRNRFSPIPLDDNMEGIQRIYDTGIGYAKARYVPNTTMSILSIILYTAVVFWITEILLRGQVTRWLYVGSIVMVISMVYAGTVRKEDLIMR